MDSQPGPADAKGQNSKGGQESPEVLNSGKSSQFMDRRIGRRTWFHYLAIGLVALTLRAGVFYELHDELPFAVLITDSRVYDQWAQSILAGDWMGGQVFYQSPLYPYSMAVIYRCFGYHPMHVRYVQALLGALACVFVALAGLRFISRSAGLAAGWMLAFYGPALFFDGLIQKSSFDLFLMSCVLALMGQFLCFQRWPWLLGMGVAFGLLVLNRENARLIFPVIIGWLLVYFRDQSWRRRLVWCAAFTIGCSLSLVPVGMRNYHVGGEFLLTTSQFGPNFYIGNHQGATGLYVPLIPGRGHTIYERTDAIVLAEQALGRTLTSGEVSDYWRDQALEYIRTFPGEWIKLMLWKSYLVLQGQELVDSEGIEVHARFSRILAICQWFSFGVLISLAVLGGWAVRSLWRRLSVLYIIALAMFASVAIFFVFARYRYPVVPVLMLLAGAALSSIPLMIADWRAGRFAAQWGPGWLAALVLLVPLSWPLPQYRDDAIAFANYGKELLDEGRLELAESALRESISVTPNAPGVQYNLGRVFELQGRMTEAIGQYELALRIDPSYGRAHWMLGRYRMSMGDPAGAAERFQAAANLVTDMDMIRTDWGMALGALGKSSEAADQFRAALKINPASALAANNLVWILATSPDDSLRNADEALHWARLLEPIDQPDCMDTVAAAYAEAQQFDKAIAIAQRAHQLARQSGNSSLAELLEQRIQLYESGQPFRDAPQTN